MHRIRAAADRGFVERDGIARRAAFTSADHHVPDWPGFGVLRVANEDVLAPGTAYAPQRRANMELLTLVLDGALRVQAGDDAQLLAPGTLHWIGAGHGIEHVAANASSAEPVHLLQFWLQPSRVNAVAAGGVRRADAIPGRWTLLAAAGSDVDGALAIRADARVSIAGLQAGAPLAFDLRAGRTAWLQVVRGAAVIDGATLSAGDALAVGRPARTLDLAATGAAGATVLLFDLPG